MKEALQEIVLNLVTGLIVIGVTVGAFLLILGIVKFGGYIGWAILALVVIYFIGGFVRSFNV